MCLFKMNDKYCFMISDAFGNMQCLLCNMCVMGTRAYNFRRHYNTFHKDFEKYEGIERDNMFFEKKNTLLQKYKDWVFQVENDGQKNYTGTETTLKKKSRA